MELINGLIGATLGASEEDGTLRKRCKTVSAKKGGENKLNTDC